MDLSSAREAAFEHHAMAYKEVAAGKGRDQGGGRVDWQEEYIKKLNDDISEVKVDLREFRGEVGKEFKSFRAEVKEEFKSFRAEVKEEFKSFREQVNAEFKSVHAEISDIKKEIGGLTRWVASFIITVVVGFLGTMVFKH